MLTAFVSCGSNSGSNPDDESDESEYIFELIPEAVMYAEILNAYQDFLYNDENKDNQIMSVDITVNNLYERIAKELNIDKDQRNYELWVSCTEMRDGNLGYAIHDINNDGIDELIILSEGDFNIHAIYSLDKDVPILIGGYWSRYRCVIDEKGTLFIHASGGAGDWYSASYRILQGSKELQLIEMYGHETYDDQTGKSFLSGQYYRIKNDNKSIIEEEEFMVAIEHFPDVNSSAPTKKAGLHFISFLAKD